MKTDFAKKLTGMFEQVEPQFRAAQVEYYHGFAKRGFEAWVERMKGPKPEPNTTGRMWLRNDPIQDAMQQPEYTRAKKNAPYVNTGSWEALQDAINAGHYEIDYERAEKHANDSVDSAKVHFVEKQSKKLENATKNHGGSPKMVGKLQFSARITGSLYVKYGKGDCFTLNMSMIVNYRHNSRRGGTTSFYQFPARFAGVQIKGVPQKGVSEAWMGENFV